MYLEAITQFEALSKVCAEQLNISPESCFGYDVYLELKEALQKLHDAENSFPRLLYTDN